MNFSLSRLKPKSDRVETLHLMALVTDMSRSLIRRDLETTLRALAMYGHYNKIEASIMGPLESLREAEGVLLSEEVAPNATITMAIRNVDVSSFVAPSQSEGPADFAARAERFRDAIIELGNLQLYSEYTPYTEKNPLFIYGHNLPLGQFPVLAYGLKKLAEWLAERELTVMILNHVHQFGELGDPTNYQNFIASAGNDLDQAESIMYPTLGNLVYLADTIDDCIELQEIGIPGERIFHLNPGVDAEWNARKGLFQLENKSAREKLDPKLAEVNDLSDQLLERLEEIFPGLDANKPCFFTSPHWGAWPVGDLFLLGRFLKEYQTEVLVPFLEPARAERFRRYAQALGPIARLAEDWDFQRVERKVSSTFQVQFLEDDLFQTMDGLLLPSQDGADLLLASLARGVPTLLCNHPRLEWLIQASGLEVPGRYDPLRVNSGDIDLPRLMKRYFERINQARQIRQMAPLSEAIFQRLFEKHKLQDGTILFADLDEETQISVIRRMQKEDTFAQAFLTLNPTLEPALDTLSDGVVKEAVHKKNLEILRKTFGLENRAKEIKTLFQSVNHFLKKEEWPALGTIKPNSRRLAEKGVSLGNLKLL